MLTKILKLKHWQLFFIVVAIPFIVQMGMFGFMFVNMMTAESADDVNFLFNNFNFYMIGFWLLSTIPQTILALWFWAIGSKIHEKVPNHLRLNQTRLKVAFACVFVVFLSFVSYMGVMMSVMNNPASQTSMQVEMSTNDTLFFVGFGVMFLMQFVAMGSMAYIFYHLGKTIKLAETKTELKLESYIADIILLWFFPIGVWFIQPRLNRLMEND